MPVYKFSTALRQSIAQAIIDAIDAGTGAGKFKFYAGSMPANADTAITSQTLLGTLICFDPSATKEAGVVNFAAITQDDAADASGTAAFVAITDSADNVIMYLDVTNEAGPGAIKLNTVNIVAGGPIKMNSQTITVGGA